MPIFKAIMSWDSGSGHCYDFRALRGKVFRFRVKAPHDTSICLTAGDRETPECMYEVLLGGWGGHKSGITKNKKHELCKVDTPNILSDTEVRGFWVVILNNVLKVGREGECSPFLTYLDDTNSLNSITHYGYCTSQGATGYWAFTDELPTYNGPELNASDVSAVGENAPAPPSPVKLLTWVPCSGGATCDGAVAVGAGPNPAVVAASYHEGGFIPGVLRHGSSVCHIPWGGSVHCKENYYVLSNTGGVELEWKYCLRGKVPKTAVLAAHTEEGENLFIGRVLKNNVYTSGKIHPSHNGCYITDEVTRLEKHYCTYSVLCLGGVRVARPPPAPEKGGSNDSPS